jgi:hypothetical protein
MYVQECLARERQRERLQQAQAERTARQITELRKLEKRRVRAERELLRAWQQVDRFRALLRTMG